MTVDHRLGLIFTNFSIYNTIGKFLSLLRSSSVLYKGTVFLSTHKFARFPSFVPGSYQVLVVVELKVLSGTDTTGSTRYKYV